jgi:hypothetical protein
MTTEFKPTAFEIALAAKNGKVDPETLRGASKHLYLNHTKKELEAYARGPQAPRPKEFIKSARRAARSF